jgi:hypothetical protein
MVSPFVYKNQTSTYLNVKIPIFMHFKQIHTFKHRWTFALFLPKYVILTNLHSDQSPSVARHPAWSAQKCITSWGLCQQKQVPFRDRANRLRSGHSSVLRTKRGLMSSGALFVMKNWESIEMREMSVWSWLAELEVEFGTFNWF